MSVLYSKLRLLVPSILDNENATITTPRGLNRTVPLTAPITDVFVAGMEKYTVSAGTGSESVGVGNGKMKKIVTEDASALTVATQPTKTTYLVGENLDISGAVINATIQKGNGTSETRNVTSLATYTPPDGTQLNTQGTQRVNIDYGSASTYFDVTVSIRSMLKKLPYNFAVGSVVVLNDEIHILGGYFNDSATNHYKWNGSNWVSVSTLPISFYYGCAVVLNNEIHILGGIAGYNKFHYKWNGSSWTSVSTLPYAFQRGCAVVLNNEIHILGGDNQTNHYKWNGSSWTSVSTLPYAFFNGSAVVLNNEIHILGGTNNQTNHYKWNGSSWTSVSTLSYNFTLGCAVVLYNEIHILGDATGAYSYPTRHYKWNGSSWVSVSTLPYSFTQGGSVVWNSGSDNEIVILGTGESGYRNYDAQWDGTSWTVGSD